MIDDTNDPNSDPSGTDTFAEQLTALYQDMLGRSPTSAEVESHRGNPGGIEGVRQTIVGSPEYQERQPGKPGPTPPPTAPPPTGGPAPPPPGVIRGPVDSIPLTPNPPPTFTPPEVNPPPAFAPPPKFGYDDFVAPNADDIWSDPGVKSRLDMGRQSIEHGAAARGVLNTGGTLNDELMFGQQLGSQEYGNLWNRRKSEYDTNRGNAFENYKTNYGIDKDVYDTNYQTQYKDPFMARYQSAQDKYNAQTHTYDQDQFYQHHDRDQSQYYDFANKQFDWKKYLDQFDMKYRLLGLY